MFAKFGFGQRIIAIAFTATAAVSAAATAFTFGFVILEKMFPFFEKPRRGRSRNAELGFDLAVRLFGGAQIADLCNDLKSFVRRPFDKTLVKDHRQKPGRRPRDSRERRPLNVPIDRPILAARVHKIAVAGGT